VTNKRQEGCMLRVKGLADSNVMLLGYECYCYWNAGRCLGQVQRAQVLLTGGGC
jgi:hypothetical protein